MGIWESCIVMGRWAELHDYGNIGKFHNDAKI